MLSQYIFLACLMIGFLDGWMDGWEGRQTEQVPSLRDVHYIVLSLERLNNGGITS